MAQQLAQVQPPHDDPVGHVRPDVSDTIQAATETHVDDHSGGFPPFEPDTFSSQLLWLALTFGALYFLMSRIALPRIGSILEVRSDRIATDLAEAQRLKTETEDAIASYEASLAAARAKAQAIAGETHEAMRRESDANRKVLEAELGERLAEAEREIAETKAAALSNVRAIAVDAAAAIVTQLLGAEPAARDVETAVDASLKN